MKICFVSETFGGGVEKVNMTLADAFGKMGHDVTVISVTDRHPHKSENKNFNTIYLERPSKKSSLLGLLRSFKRVQPDVIVVSSILDVWFSLFCKWIANLSSKIVYVQHSVYSKASLHSFKERLLTNFGPRAMHLFNHIDGIIFVSKGVKRDFEGYFPNLKVIRQVVYNPISYPHEIKRMIPIPGVDGKIKLVTAGRIEPEKDQGMIIKAVEILRKRGLDVSLSIFGVGSQKEKLTDLVCQLGLTSYVRFEGYHSNIQNLFPNYHIFVLSSLHESFGNVLVEAMNQGLAVVSTNCPVGPREILGDGKYGDLVPVKDPLALADAVQNIASRLTDEMMENNYSRSLKFSVSASADEYINYFRKIL